MSAKPTAKQVVPLRCGYMARASALAFAHTGLGGFYIDLQAAHAGRWAPELLMSLPVVGVDGTMRNRLKTGPAAGLARMKTGTLRNVAALAGFVDDPQGRRHVLVAIINHDQARAGRAALDALVDWVARGGPDAR